MVKLWVGPTDIVITFLTTVGQDQSFLRNKEAMDILDQLGGWKMLCRETGNKAIVGPMLFVCLFDVIGASSFYD